MKWKYLLEEEPLKLFKNLQRKNARYLDTRKSLDDK